MTVSFVYILTESLHVNHLSLHDALPISFLKSPLRADCVSALISDGIRLDATLTTPLAPIDMSGRVSESSPLRTDRRSEEHTSELQSLRHIVCRLLLEKKKIHVHTTLVTR